MNFFETTTTDQDKPQDAKQEKQEKPKRRIPIKKYIKKEKCEDETNDSIINTLKNTNPSGYTKPYGDDPETDSNFTETLDSMSNVMKGSVDVVKSLIPDQDLDTKKLRLRQYMRSRPLIQLGKNAVNPEFEKIDKMKESEIDSKLDSYDFFINQETTNVLSSAVINFACGSVDSWARLDGRFNKKCLEDESLKADIQDELSRFSSWISRPIRIISRLALNAVESFKETKTSQNLVGSASVEEILTNEKNDAL
jgi:hypothetical protein